MKTSKRLQKGRGWGCEREEGREVEDLKHKGKREVDKLAALSDGCLVCFDDQD